MPSRRMIDPAFWESLTVASWPVFQRLLFAGLFSHADDQGRLKGHPVLVRSKVFPYDDFPMADIEQALVTYEESGSIIRYEVDGVANIQLVNWWKWQHASFAWPSKMPPPPGWEDRHCYRKGNVVVKHNWDGSDRGSESDDGKGGAIVGPESAHGRATVSPAPSISISNRVSGSGNDRIAPAPPTPGGAGADGLIIDLTALNLHSSTAKKLVSQYQAAGNLDALVDYADGWITHYKGQPNVGDPVALAVPQLRLGLAPPRPPPSLLCEVCHMRPCECEEEEEVKV